MSDRGVLSAKSGWRGCSPDAMRAATSTFGAWPVGVRISEIGEPLLRRLPRLRVLPIDLRLLPTPWVDKDMK